MALSLQLGYPDVPKSITNPSVDSKYALDSSNPFSFLTFIKIITVSYEPDTLKKYYTYYLKAWNKLQTKKTESNAALIKNKYRDFLKDLSLHYTTLEEKKFLTKINFDDPLDLDIAIGFFGRKLKDITSFYNEKRNNAKYSIIKNKLKGTNFGTEKTLIDLTLNYLKNNQDNKILYDYDSLRTEIEIEIEELFDTYPLYFNQTPDSTKYDNKDLDYDLDLFIRSNSDIISKDFSEISSSLQELKELDDLLDNKRELTKKDIFTNFYYLSTGSTTTQFLSGKLFESYNNISSFLNRDYPTTASTDRKTYKTPREKGFFRPTNTSILLIDGKNQSYSFNLSNLKPNSLYYFPDPNIFGENGDVMTFIVDDSFLKRNNTSGIATNQPTSTDKDPKYHGYVSRLDPNTQKYLDNIFDRGYIKDQKQDFYGNLYGLFDNSGKYRKSIENIYTDPTINMLFNGYLFYDNLYWEGYNFDYTVVDELSTYSQTIRTGLSSYTNGLSVVNPEVTFNFGKFTPYIELIKPTQKELVPQYVILEGAFLRKANGKTYDETYSSDLSAFDTETGIYYYNYLIDGGISIDSPLTRAYSDATIPSLSADATLTTKTSAIYIFDGDTIVNNDHFNIKINDDTYYYLNQTNLSTTLYNLSSYPSEFEGKLFIKNSKTKKTSTIIDEIPFLKTRYDSSIYNELSSQILEFELANETLIIKTDNYLIFEKLNYSNGKYTDPKTSTISFQYNKNWCDVFTNRYKVENSVYYCNLTTTTNELSAKTVTVYPIVYKYDIINNKNVVLYDSQTEDFSITNDTIISSVENATLTYNSRNNIYKISFILKDINNYPIIVEYDYKLKPSVIFLKKKIIKFDNYGYTDLYETLPSTHSFYLSSSAPITNSYELIL